MLAALGGARHRCGTPPTSGGCVRHEEIDLAIPEARLHQVRKAVIPAAGLGTRFLPATKSVPKEMLPVIDRPAIQYVVEEAVRAGLTDILIVTGRKQARGRGALRPQLRARARSSNATASTSC